MSWPGDTPGLSHNTRHTLGDVLTVGEPFTASARHDAPSFSRPR